MDWSGIFNNNFVFKLIAAAIELVVGFSLGPICRNLIMRLHSRKGVDEGVLTFTGAFVNITIRVLAVIIALGQIGADVTAVVGIFSAMGLGVSLALKESMTNVAGGLQILLTRPFKVGDYIACDTQEGTVTEISLMFSTLKTFDNQMVVIPNSILVSNTLVNYSAYPERRLVMSVPVSAVGDYEVFEKGILEIVSSRENILKNPAPKTVIGDLNEQGNALPVKVVCYTLNEYYWDEKFELNKEVLDLRRSLSLDPPATWIQAVSK